MTGDSYTWLYAVAPSGTDLAVLRGMSGVAGEHPRLITAADLAAVVGSVPSSDFDAPALHDHLQDPHWLEHAVRAHHQVIDALARGSRTLPLRFATLYRDDQRVSALLDEHHREFRTALDRVAGRTEWGVKAYLDSARLHDDNQGADGRDGTASTGRPGTAYLLRRRAARDRNAQALDDAVERARQVHHELTAVAEDSAEHPLQTPEATGIRDPMVLNGAYLVDHPRAEEFAQVVAGLQDAHRQVLRIELTGPWPPYSFVDLPLATGGK
ncbi:GvpL/GvpF family gas vesicle protein [Kitasatospora sp. RB6PN24]|uniref:GvpL/GvpF family gas vesicle protein n=1 Tax=Kitasatospora humi TaxID=2893891 RepID=UPI001E643599|nr:GvpL/GvpF family gas vesicle protein [Kitasatospora humi]MCC9307829.1 GvpL/GvpF family gas vesicle protein [Kitasatospora humi]